MRPRTAAMHGKAVSTAPSFLAGGGEMGARIRAFDGASTSLGSTSDWPQSLKTLVSVMLAAKQPMFIAWGRERTLLYNDPYAPLLGRKHPAALGQPFLDVWAEARADRGGSGKLHSGAEWNFCLTAARMAADQER